MIAGKHINKIVLLAVIVALIFCVIAMIVAPKLVEKYGTGISMEYETRMFDTSEPLTIDIQMDADEWQTMLNKATQEVYYVCDVVINGTKFYDVGIRPKGNTSLSSIAMNPNTERFSFKLEFDQFVDGQSAWGLDKLCLNNNYADATNMKEALIYDMYQYLGADASLYNYAAIYVNGEYWGVYLALEAVEDSFMLRNYGVTNGELYKPDTMGMSWGGDWGGWGNDDSNWFTDLIDSLFGGDDNDDASGEPRWGRDSENDDASGESRWGSSRRSRQNDASAEPTAAPNPMPPQGELSETMQAIVDEIENSKSASGESSDEASGESGWRWGDEWSWGDDDGGGFGGGMFGNGGGNLNYTGDDLSNYSTIWGSEVTTTDEADHKRVVQALKNVSEGVNLEESMDIDNLLRFMAVHNFSVNWDSLSGSMAHNYYLYESDGQLNIIPWDYNLAFGSMGSGGSAKSAINDPIDDSWQSTNFFDPLLENEEYLAKYHEYYRLLVEEYIFGGLFDEFYDRTREQIDDLVAADPNALYDCDEYDAAAETLYHVVKLRGESILGQLDGTIPSTTSGQRQDSSSLIEGENINLSLMGSMSMGGSFGGGGGWENGFNPFRRDDSASNEASSESGASGEESEEASGEQTETAYDEASDAASGDPSDETNYEQTEAASTEQTGTEPASEESWDSASDEPSADSASDENDEASDEQSSGSVFGDASDTEEDASDEMSSRDRGDWFSASREMQQAENTKKIWLLGAFGVLLIAGLVFAVCFKKKG